MLDQEIGSLNNDLGAILTPAHSFMSSNAKRIMNTHKLHPHTAMLADIFEVHPVSGEVIAGNEFIAGWFKNLINHVSKQVSNVVHDVSKDVTSVVKAVEKDVEKVAKNVGNLAKKSFQIFKTVNFAIPRGAFLGLVAINVHGFATHLLNTWNKNPNPLEKLWHSLGGDVDKLKNTIFNGAKKKRILGPESIGQTVPAMLASATPVIIAVLKIMDKSDPKAINDMHDAANAALEGAAAPGFNPMAEAALADTSGTIIPAPGAGSGGASVGSFGSIGGFMFKSLLVLSNPFLFLHIHLNSIVLSILGSLVLCTPLFVYGYKKITK